MSHLHPLAMLGLFLLMLTANVASGQTRPPGWLAGERLTFAAEFLHMELGWVQFEMLPEVDTLGTTLWHARATIRSNPRIPLMQAYVVFESYFDEAFNSYLFKSQERKGDGLRFSISTFGRDDHRLTTHEWREAGSKVTKERVYSCTLRPGTRDGLATFYYLRSRTDLPLEPEPFYVLTGSRPDSVFIRREAAASFAAQDLEAQAAAPVICRLPFTAIAGLKKEIRSYFSTDGLALPLSTELQVYIGKVKLQLVDQHREPAMLTEQDHRADSDMMGSMEGTAR